MAGHVHKHGDGWQVILVDGYGRGAKRRVIGTWRRKADAENELRLAEAEVLTGSFVDRQAGKVSLVERMRQDIERRQDHSLNTSIGYANALAHVEAFFGTKSIAAIKHSDMQAFVSSLDLAPSTVHTVYKHLRATIRTAIADGIVGRDPCIKIKLPPIPNTGMVIPTDDEVEQLHRCAVDGFGAAIVLGAGCGLRAQEAAGITVGDIDFFTKELSVRQQWHGRLSRFEPLKGRHHRTVPVNDDILNALSAHIAAFGTGDHDVVLHDDDRQPLNAARMQWRWQVTKRAAGLEMRYHSLRHHFASTGISAGVPLPALSRALGHSGPSITLDVYGHLMVDDDDRLRSAPTARFGRKETA